MLLTDKKGGRSRPFPTTRCRDSGHVVRETHGGGAGAVVGLDVDQRHHALVHLLLGAFQGRADVLGVLDIFAVRTEALRHNVVPRIAKIAARLVALGIGGPAAIEADDAEQRQFMPYRGVELHRVLPERAVAVQADDLVIRLRCLGADREGQADPHRAERPRIEAMPRREGRNRLAAKIEDLLPVDAQDRIALLEILDLLAESQRMYVAIGRVTAAGPSALCRLAFGQLLAPGLEAVGGLIVDRVDQLLQYALAVAHHRDIDIAGGTAELLGIDLDARDLRVLVEARRRRMRDDVIHPGAENDDQIGFLERVRTHRQIRIRVIVGHDATALRGRIEWDAGLIDELPHLFPGVRPQHAAPGADDRLPRLLDRIDESVDRLRFGIGPRLQDRPAHIAPIDLVFLHLGVEDVAGKIEINGPWLAKQRGLEREIHLLRNALQIVHAVGIFHLAFEAFDLIDLLEDLATELADRARSADRDDRTAIDKRVGEAGAEIECRRTARRHADARPLCHARIGLRHVGSTLLMARVYEADAFLDAGQLGIEHRPAHDEEQILDILRLQAARENFIAGQFRHRGSPLLSFFGG